MAFKGKWSNPSGSRTYYAWRSMRNRCYNVKNHSFEHYGGRGIEVCQQWRDDFDQFVAWSEIYGIAEQLGFASEHDAWDENPIIQGSVIPSDFRVS